MANDRLGMVVNLANLAPTQYLEYNFNSMIKFGDVYLGANEDGIWSLGDNDYDNYVSSEDKDNISAWVELLTTDFGLPNQKRLRRAYIGYETDGSIILKVKNDDGNERSFTLTKITGSDTQEGAKITIDRDGKGRYWNFRFENVAGSYFAIDSVDLVAFILGRKPSGG